MIVKELTKFYKVNNVILNILIWLLSFSSILLLISYIFYRNTEWFQQSYIQLFFLISLAVLIVSLAVIIIRDNTVRTIEVDIDKNTMLEINTNEEIEKIQKHTSIRYSGNYIITKNHKVEIHNQSTFTILNQESIKNMRKVNNKTFFIENEPGELFDRLIVIIRFGMSFGVISF